VAFDKLERDHDSVVKCRMLAEVQRDGIGVDP